MSARRPEPARERKHHALSHQMPSHVAGIASAVALKRQDLFFVSERDGFVPLTPGHGLGLYYNDCRYLSGYELRLDGRRPESLVANGLEGFRAVFQLTRAETGKDAGPGAAEREAIEVKVERVLGEGPPTLEDRLVVHNYGWTPAQVELSLTMAAAFDDVFAVRGLLVQEPGERREPTWRDGALVWRYLGRDGVERELVITFDPAPTATTADAASFSLVLPPGGDVPLRVSMAVREDGGAPPPGPTDLEGAREDARASYDRWLADLTRVRSDSLLLDRVVTQGLRDLRTLRSEIDGLAFFAAGVPWFATLFGRDALISAYQALAYAPDVAAQTLRLLARYQGRRFDGWRDEEPGMILHELRVGELARTGAIPHTPWYGSIDATPLFLIVLARHAAWTGDLALFRELRPNVEAALGWIDRRLGEDGFLAYTSDVGTRIVNQGWKDSGDAVVNDDGRLADPPIALIEVQAYAHAAWLAAATLFGCVGEADRAATLRDAAADLARRIDAAFWQPGLGFHALALQAGGRPADVVASNPGHALWTGTLAEDRAAAVVARLMRPDMFSGWGVRTLSSRERRYNPVSYHLGTVWPHDNALLAAGFRRYGHDEAAGRVFRGLFEAASRFAHHRMPELFCGFGDAEYGEPVHYPVACHPQAWAAGAIPFLLVELLGLVPEALDGRLRVVRPWLPAFVDRLAVEGLRVGPARVDLRFARSPQGVEVEARTSGGPLEVVVEPAAARAPAPGSR